MSNGTGAAAYWVCGTCSRRCPGAHGTDPPEVQYCRACVQSTVEARGRGPALCRACAQPQPADRAGRLASCVQTLPLPASLFFAKAPL